jgi:hypothetical protein
MVERPRDGHLAAKSLGVQRTGETRLHDLDGDTVLVTNVSGEKDRRHAAVPELALDLIRTGEGLCQLLPHDP